MRIISSYLLVMFLGLVCLNPVPALAQDQLSAAVTDDLDKVARLNQAGDFKQALEILQKLRRDYPDDKQVLFDYLTTLTWLERYQEAGDLAAGLAQLSPPDYVLAAAAQSLRHSGRPKQAEDLYLEGQRRFPGQTDFILGQVLTLADESRFAEARYLLNQYKNQAPAGSEAKTAEAEAYLTNQENRAQEANLETSRHEAAKLARQGQYEEALNRLAKLKADHPDNLALSFDYLTILSWAGWHQEAAALADGLEADLFPIYVLKAAAGSYRETGQFEKSEKSYLLGLAKQPDDPELLAGLQLTLDRRDGLEQARKIAEDSQEEAINASVADQPQDGGESAASAAERAPFNQLRDEAVSLARAGEYRASLASLEALQKEQPDNQDILADRITVHSWAGQHARAAGLSQELKIEEAPEYAVAAAASSLRKSGRLAWAQAWHEKALKRFPDNFDLNIGYALTLGERGRASQGLDHLDAYGRQHPKADSGRLNETRLYLRKRLTAKAAPSAPARPQAPYRAEQDQAVLLARAGRLDESLTALERLYQEHPQDQAVLVDYVTILSWRHNYDKVVELTPHLDLATIPAYAVEAVTEAFMATGDYYRARRYVEQAIERQQRNPELLISGALILARSGDYVQAAAYLDEAGKSRRPGLSNQLEAAKKAVGYNRVKAMADLAKANRALAENPYDRQALRLKVLALSGAGAGRLAWDLNQPGLNLSADQLKNLEIAAGLQEIQVDEMSGPIRNINRRYQRYHEALAALDRLRLDPDCAAITACRTRVRLARLEPLSELNRLAGLVDEYETLKEETPLLPVSAELTAGGAYLALRQPQKAGEIYQGVLDRRRISYDVNSSDLYEAQKGLFWSLLESEHLPEALTQARTNYETRRPQDGRPPWISDDWTTADSYLTLGRAYLYTGFLARGQKHFQEIAAQDPANVNALSGLALSQSLRGQPRKALEIIRQAQALDPENIGLMIQEANALMAAKKWRQAHEIITSLKPYAPYSTAVQQLLRSWETHNLFVARVSLSWSDTSSDGKNAYTPGQSPTLEASLYSPPIKYNWRIYAGTALEGGKFREGNAHQEMVIGGLEYRGSLVEISLEARASQINRPPHDNGRNRGDARRGGGGLSGVITPDDHWRFPFSIQLRSRNTPLRALYNGLTADEYLLGAAYHWNEGRFLKFSGSYMDFSDGNERLAVQALFNQRLLSAYNHTLDAQLDLYASHNSKDDDRLYYNPKDDFSYGAGLIYRGPIWRRYDHYLSHTLSASLGGYYQKGDHRPTGSQDYGSDLIWNLGYSQNLDWTDRFAAAYGLNYGRRVYDGDPERNLNLHLTIVWKF